MVGRTFKAYLGVWLSITKSKDPLKDTMRITLGETIKPFKTSIKFFTKSKLVQIENNSILELPISCSLLTTNMLWAAPTLMHDEAEQWSDSALINIEEGKLMGKVTLRN